MLGDHQMYVVLLINNKRKGAFKSIIISRQPPVINFLNFHFYVCFISVYSDVSTRIYRWQIYTPCRSHAKVIFFYPRQTNEFFSVDPSSPSIIHVNSNQQEANHCTTKTAWAYRFYPEKKKLKHEFYMIFTYNTWPHHRIQTIEFLI